MKQSSISQKILFLVVGIILFLSVMMNVFIDHQVEGYLMDQIEMRMLESSTSLTGKVKEFVVVRQKLLMRLAHNQTLRLLVADEKAKDVQEAEDLLLNFSGYFYELSILDRHGNDLAKVENGNISVQLDKGESGEPFFARARESGYFQDVVNYNDGVKELYMSVSIHDLYDEFAGVLLAEIPDRKISEIIHQFPFGQGVKGFLVDESGDVIGQEKGAIRITRRDIKVLDIKREIFSFNYRHDAARVLRRIIVQGKEGLGVIVPFGFERWQAFLWLDRNVLVEQIDSLQKMIWTITLFSAFVCGLVGVWFSRSISVPLRALVKSIEGFTQGQVKKVEITSSSQEAHQLASAFNRMVEDISRYQAELVETVSELKESNQRLSTLGAQLVQAEKMAAIGQLSAGVAHEINNPTAFVVSNLDIMTKAWPRFNGIVQLYEEIVQCLESEDMARAHELAHDLEALKKEMHFDDLWADFPSMVNESLDGAERIKRIVLDLKTFSRTDVGLLQESDINEQIDLALNIARNELKNKVEVVREYGELAPVLCYPQRIGQLFLNLVVNAAQAINGQGRLLLRTRMADENVVVEVIDTGSGMTEEVQKHLFEPFFTTKPVGRGTGLGLSCVYNIVMSHEGSVHVKSAPGQGTTFMISLPVKGPVNVEKAGA